MRLYSKLLLVTSLAAAVMLPGSSAFSETLDYTFEGQFFAGSFLDATLLDGKDFEVHIIADTTIADTDPGDPQRGEFLGPFSAQINIEGLGIYNFVNPISRITEWTAALAFQPVEAKAIFGGGSTSSMTGFSPDTITPFFGDPNLLNPFPGGANVVVADFNHEPIVALGETDLLDLNGQSPGGSVRATAIPAIPDSGSTLFMVGMVVAGLATYGRLSGKCRIRFGSPALR